MATTLVWFRNCLRLHDNLPLIEAAKSTNQLVCVFVFTPSVYDPKYMGIKLSENFIAADSNTQQAYKAITRQDLLGFHQCSESLKGSLGKNADGCKWLTEDYSEVCPFR